MSKIIEEQLHKVEYADLSNFDKETNTYFIKKRVELKPEVDCCYLIHLRPTLFHNEVLKINWNAGSMPTYTDMKAEISKIMGKMIKVVGVGYDVENNQDLSGFWSGWLSLPDIELVKKL